MYQLKGAVRFFALLAAKILPGYRAKNNGKFEPFKVIYSSSSILVCMPFDYNEFQAAMPVLNELAREFPECYITVAVIESFRNWLERPLLSKIIPLRPYHANIFKLPSGRLKQDLLEKSYDIAVNLNHDDKLFSSILCAVSGAVVRVGFADGECDKYYNFLVRPKDSLDIRAKYVTLLNYIRGV